MAGAVKAARSDSSVCRVGGENIEADDVLSNFFDQDQRLEKSSPVSSSSDNIQAKETPNRSEYIHTSEMNNTIISKVQNLVGHGVTGRFEGKDENYFPKWRLPSKIRRKFSTVGEDSMQEVSKPQDLVNDTCGSRSPKNVLRVCEDCNTTKTPLWRSGPQGPKSLCNACGIRYRKKRRALFASLNSENSEAMHPKKRINLLGAANAVKKQNKVNKFFAFCHRHGIENDVYGSRPSIPTKHSTIQRRFAEEEEEAAKLLMAISYGLVYA